MLPDNIVLTDTPGRDLERFLTSRNYSKILVLTDENTYPACYSKIAASLPAHGVLTLSSGEEEKVLRTCEKIWHRMTDEKLDRHAVVIIIGGGVLGDMGGFCAATYKRGIDFILLPTTLLAQADASIGGKLGIDFNNLKNHLGVFKQPALTVLYAGFLETLPLHELRSGFAEVIKHALIGDKALWEQIRANDLATQNWPALIKHSAEFKCSITARDPHEKGIRKILNAGHTVGHALESYFLGTGNKILHGEAVAAGLVAEAELAYQKKLITKEARGEISAYIFKIFGKLTIPEKAVAEIAELCLQDKKNRDSRVLAVLPEGIGKAKWDVEVSLEEIKSSLEFYRAH